MTKELWFDLWQGQEIFLFSKISRLALGPTQLPIQYIPVRPSLEVMWLKHYADDSSPPSTNVKDALSPIPFTPS
jgi:hypothetical protein